MRVGRLTVTAWPHGRSRQFYFWWPGWTLSVSIYRKGQKP